VVPIGVDVDYFAKLDRHAALGRVGLEAGNRYVVFVGHFAPWVDFDTLLRAFAIVARERPDARFLLVGDGEQRTDVEAMIRTLDIERSVTLTGYLRDREAVRDLLASATVLVASHRGEHLDRIGMNATKIAEYLASGRAVVAKDVARLREMIEEPGAGRVARDAEEMAAAISSLLDPALADAVGAVGRELAASRYSWDSTVSQTLPMFTSPCSRD
jgi:glycosyltransferase involved in cell wall biosynthesis